MATLRLRFSGSLTQKFYASALRYTFACLRAPPPRTPSLRDSTPVCARGATPYPCFRSTCANDHKNEGLKVCTLKILFTTLCICRVDCCFYLNPCFLMVTQCLWRSIQTFCNHVLQNSCDVTFWPDNLCYVRGCSAMSSRDNRKDQLDSARITAHCNPRPPHLCPRP